MPLISLNDLPNERHNVLIKLFASKKREIMAVTEKLRQHMGGLPEYLINYVRDFITNLLTEGGEDMDWLNLTPEDKTAMRKRWLKMLYSAFSPEEIMSVYKTEEIMSMYKPEERLAGLKPEERLAGLKPKERLAGLKLEERLAGMKPEELEAYLLRIKRTQAGKTPKSG